MGRGLLVALILVGILLTVTPGCNKVTKENYEKVKVGMTVDEVEDILGKGEMEEAGATLGELTGSASVCTWTKGDAKITVTFVNDKVKTVTQTGLE